MHFLITFPEITLKSVKVRLRMEQELQKDIKNRLGERKIENLGGMFHFEGEEKDINVLTHTPGVATIFVCDVIEGEELLEKVFKRAVEIASDFKGTFAVKSKNTIGSSTELNRMVGEKIVNAYGLKVNLKNPQNTLFIRLENKKAYIGYRLLTGIGGLPYNSQGNVLVLFSGGIDSPLAAFMFLRKGCRPYFLFFDISPFSGKGVTERAISTLEKLKMYCPAIELITIPFGSILNKISESQKRNLTCVMCKRSMYKAANIIAKKLNAKAIVTGDSLGEVGSQTLPNLAAISQASEIMVLRPLIGFTKQESVDASKKYGLFDAYSKLVSCTAVPAHVETNALIEKVKIEEEKLGLDKIISECVEKAKFEKI